MKLDVDGQIRIEEAEGNGPVDAVFNCIKLLVPHEAKLELYQVHAVTEGTDAQAEVSVRLAREGRSSDRTRGGSGYAGGVGEGLSRRAQQNRHEAPARRRAVEGCGLTSRHRHCERSEAIQISVRGTGVDCFAALAMAASGAFCIAACGKITPAKGAMVFGRSSLYWCGRI